MKTHCVLILALVLASGAAIGREAKDKGGYVGGAFGVTSFEDDNAPLAGIIDDDDNSFQIYGGYKFLRYFALEGRLLSLGTYRDAFSEIEAKAATVNAVGIVPFGQSDWEFFGQLGFGTIRLERPGGTDSKETVGSAGIGFRVTPIEHLSISLQLDAYAWEQDIGAQTFDWAIGATQIAFHYNF
jgi:hypothetical protein